MDFLVEPKQRWEIEKKFHLSNTQSYNLVKWMRNAKLIIESNMIAEGKGGRIWLYQKKKEKRAYRTQKK